MNQLTCAMHLDQPGFVNNLQGSTKKSSGIIGLPETLEDCMKFLVIDNDPAIIDIIQNLPVDSPPMVLYTSSPNNGITLVKLHQPEFIFIGALLDGISGIELCKVVRQFSKAPLFISSALDDPQILVAALNAGADDYLIKPISNRVLAAKIKASVRRFTTRPLDPVSVSR